MSAKGPSFLFEIAREKFEIEGSRDREIPLYVLF